MEIPVRKLPTGTGMRIIQEMPEQDFHPGKQRFIVEFLINRELTCQELFAMVSGSDEGFTDDINTRCKGMKIEKEKAKNHQFHKKLFEDAKTEYVTYRYGYVGEKDMSIEDIEMELGELISDILGGDLELLWSDIWKVRRFPNERAHSKVLSIPEDKVMELFGGQ